MQHLKIKRYFIVILLLIAIAYGSWKAVNFSPFEEDIFQKEKINSFTTLYVTEGSAGATTKYVYNYYLVPTRITDSDFLKGIGNKYSSFLSTSDENVKIEIGNSIIHLRVKGVIYHFTNAASYSSTIYLNAAPF